MKRLSGQIFPIVLLTLLAGLSFWLERAVDFPEGKRDGKTRHDPDSFVEHFTIKRFDAGGVLSYRLTAPRMVHYGDDDSSLLNDPNLVHYRPGSPDMTLVGKQGYVASEGETVFFWDDVVATRAATPERPAMVAKMADITIQPDAGTAFTNSTVDITQDRSWMRGTGLYLDNNTSVMTLQSQVTGIYYRPKTSP